MKRLLKLSGFVVLVTVINVVSLVVLVGPIISTAGPPGARDNGDVNGDGGIDIGDAIYLLAFLFNQGPPPVAIAGDPVLEELASHLTVEFLNDGQGGTVKTLRLTGVNLQILNGLGATNGNPGDPDSTTGTVNGLGTPVPARPHQAQARSR